MAKAEHKRVISFWSRLINDNPASLVYRTRAICRVTQTQWWCSVWNVPRAGKTWLDIRVLWPMATHLVRTRCLVDGLTIHSEVHLIIRALVIDRCDIVTNGEGLDGLCHTLCLSLTWDWLGGVVLSQTVLQMLKYFRCRVIVCRSQNQATENLFCKKNEHLL